MNSCRFGNPKKKYGLNHAATCGKLSLGDRDENANRLAIKMPLGDRSTDHEIGYDGHGAADEIQNMVVDKLAVDGITYREIFMRSSSSL